MSANVSGNNFLAEGLSGAGIGGNGRDPGRVPRLDRHDDSRVAWSEGFCLFRPVSSSLWRLQSSKVALWHFLPYGCTVASGGRWSPFFACLRTCSLVSGRVKSGPILARNDAN